MRVIDPGHVYECDSYDGGEAIRITFMKREGAKYPGNVGSHPGTNLQEVMRVLIHRTRYLDNQDQDACNAYVIDDQRSSIRNLEMRAARRHGRPNPSFTAAPETMPTCGICGHIVCLHDSEGETANQESTS